LCRLEVLSYYYDVNIPIQSFSEDNCLRFEVVRSYYDANKPIKPIRLRSA
jgi:hypothetical protein